MTSNGYGMKLGNGCEAMVFVTDPMVPTKMTLKRTLTRAGALSKAACRKDNLTRPTKVDASASRNDVDAAPVPEEEKGQRHSHENQSLTDKPHC